MTHPPPSSTPSSPVADTNQYLAYVTGCQSALYAFICSLLGNSESARDVLQETNLVLWKKAAEFDPLREFKASFDEASGEAINYGYLGPGDGNTNNLVPGENATRVLSNTNGAGIQLGNAASFSAAHSGTTGLFVGTELTDEGFTKYAIELWAQIDQTSSVYLMEHGTPHVGVLNNKPSVIANFNANRLELFSGTHTGAAGPTSPTSWPHIVAVVASTGSHDFYINGVHAGTDHRTFSQTRTGYHEAKTLGADTTNAMLYDQAASRAPSLPIA